MILPSKIVELIDWCEVRVNPWAAAPASIGLTAPQAAAFGAATAAARNTYSATQEAELALANARGEQAIAIRNLRRTAGDDVRLIKAFAEMQADPDAVYNLAGIPAPQPRSEVPPPGQPGEMTVGLDPTSGAIELKWKCTNPPGASGTAYIVRRRTIPGGPFVFVGVTGEKRFVDSSFNAGPDRVEYTVQGQRADSAGPESQILAVNFGVPAGPGMARSMTFTTMSGEAAQPMKRAA